MLFTPGEVKSVLLLKGLLVENPAWTNPNPEHVVRRGKKKKDPSVVAPDPEKDPSVVAPGSLVGFREMLSGEQPADPFKAITACGRSRAHRRRIQGRAYQHSQPERPPAGSPSSSSR